ncbi:hypothetical protein CDFC105_103927 [Clostridioides difficile]|nr:hypothetical protein CDFC105_103927 [Clostridioides difficile]
MKNIAAGVQGNKTSNNVPVSSVVLDSTLRSILFSSYLSPNIPAVTKLHAIPFAVIAIIAIPVNNEEHIIAVLDLTHPNIPITVAGIASILPSTPTTNNIDVDIGNNLPNSQKPPFWKKPNI